MAETLSPGEVYSLLSKLCIDPGFCLPPDEIERLQESPPRGVDEFTDAVFFAESLDPATADKALLRQVRDLVSDAFGNRRAP